jgi:RHS repeat-associated protein
MTSTGTASSNGFQYTGRENDGTGLMYYRARYYSPGLQRFISQDPLGFGGGDLNLYGYVGNLPTTFSDPQGTFGVGMTGGVSGAIGFGAGFAATASVSRGILCGYRRRGGTGSGVVTASTFLSGGISVTTPLGQSSYTTNPNLLFPDLVLGASYGAGVGFFPPTLTVWMTSKVPSRPPSFPCHGSPSKSILVSLPMASRLSALRFRPRSATASPWLISRLTRNLGRLRHLALLLVVHTAGTDRP